ncbi:MAG: Holliday junction resolvase RuvX [Faecalibacterium sp.]|nr:Holliday junction resolvase RuvX [Ruminococcus sp.]MCM1392083.1 Holliday junction resolvase RuvX [Ruminococcus sp.]MCM1485008.1 Holliday junction resolvase RuvX [Faecalibacterium sp.]
MVIMSVDYGDARTGLAACDKNEMLASPLGVIFEKYEPKLIEQICAMVEQVKPELIVVGLPKNMDGSCGERAEKCRAFAAMLEEKSGIKTAMQDERLTTVSAHRALNEVNVRGKKRKNVVDAVSAVMILEDFLAARKRLV